MMKYMGLMLAMLGASAFAHDGDHAKAANNAVTAKDCIIQQVVAGKHMTAAFVTFDNTGDKDVTLTGAAIPELSKDVELHEMKVEDGVMKMQQIKEYVLKPGVSQFKKGGYHVMVMNISKNPEVGAHYQIDFSLSDGEKLGCDATVWSVEDVMKHYAGDMKDMKGMKGMDHSSMKGMDHGDMKNMKHGDMDKPAK